jgi:peptidylprolyl isomerase
MRSRRHAFFVIMPALLVGACAGPEQAEPRDHPDANDSRTPTQQREQAADEATSAAAETDTQRTHGPANTPTEMRIDELRVIDLRPGTGAAVEPDSRILARLTGRLRGGEVFQRTEGAVGPWPLASLVEGLRRGLEGMAEGGRRRIIIPPELAYGDEPVVDPATGATLIPAGSVLEYEVELLEVIEPPGDPAPDKEAP